MTDNTFSRDDLSKRAERLLLIQQNFASHSAELVGLPAAIGTWAADCYDVYETKRLAASVQEAESTAATNEVKETFALLKKEFMAARKFARDLFADETTTFMRYDFHQSYPINQTKQLEHVKSALNENADLITEGAALVLPPSIVTRLTNAYNAADAAYKNKAVQKKQSNNAFRFLETQRKLDTKFLKTLYHLAVIVWGDDSGNLNDLGFARASQMGSPSGGSSGGGGTPPPPPPPPPPAPPLAPTGLVFNEVSSELSWNASAGATDYIAFQSPNGTSFVTVYSGTATIATMPFIAGGARWLKVAAHGDGGYSDDSAVLVVPPITLNTPQNLAYNHGAGQLTWDAVAGAVQYAVKYAPTGTTAYIDLSLDGAVGYNHTFPSGSWDVYVTAKAGLAESAAAVITITVA